MYYSHTVHGHFSLISDQQDINALIENEKTEETLRTQLMLIKEALKFAEHRLKIPQARTSYQRYVQLERDYPAWSITVTPDDSLVPETWCYPFTGCMTYRNYYSLEKVKSFAEQLSKQGGSESYISGVDAYSTLGWFDDPVLSSFFKRDEPELFGLIFHELAHQVLYVQGDTTFNESFASAVEQSGVELWLKKKPDLITQYQERKHYASKFLSLLKKTRSQLEDIYTSDSPRAIKLSEKQKIISNLKIHYDEMKTREWDGYTGFDGWFKKPVNNARLALVNTYTQWVPAFKNWIKTCDYDFPKFYQATKELAEQDQAERHRVLSLYSSISEQSTLMTSSFPSSPVGLEVKTALSRTSDTTDASSLPCKYSPNS